MSRQINLLDERFRVKKEWLTGENLLLAALLAMALVAMGATVASWKQAAREQLAQSISGQLVGERAAFSEMAKALGGRSVDPQLEQQRNELEGMLKSTQMAVGLLRTMTSQQTTPVVGEMMRALSRSAGDGLWLTAFSVREGGQQLELRGRMLDQALLPAYLKRLEAESVFHGRRFSALDMQGAEWVAPTQPVTPPVAGTGQAPSGRWYVDFVLRTQRLEKQADPVVGGGR